MFRVRRKTTAVAAAAGVSAVAAVAAADDNPEPPAPAVDPATSEAAQPRTAATVPKRRAPGRYTILRVRRGKAAKLRARPGGKVVARVGSRTEFGSQQTLTVVERRGGWVGVTSSERPNRRLGWVEEDASAFERARTQVSLRIDLSKRTLTYEKGRTRRTVRVGIGGSASPTPTGRFAITDKLRGGRYRNVYGCCILAMSGSQEQTPPGWTGGDRLAIHGASAPQRFTGATAGCVRAEARALKMLMRNVPLGTPVFVRN
jgi:lipoprotein-anchoring transpeptidase ErfK/SrfK